VGELSKEKTGAKTWTVMADTDHLQWAADAWCNLMLSDRISDRLFLSVFAVYLVKHFRAREERLVLSRAVDIKRHQLEHARLVQQLRSLMENLDLGMNVKPGIHRFLEDWRAHQMGAFHAPWGMGFRTQERSPVRL